jgi:photosystem II stability/assembly factor-like uncharacterized protein
VKKGIILLDLRLKKTFMKKYILLSLCFLFYLCTFAQWTQRSSGSSLTIFDVQMLSSTNGYWVGSSGIYQTSTSGVSWSNIPSITNFSGRSLYFFNMSTGVVGGSDLNADKILYTNNGGTSWTTAYSDVTALTNGEHIDQITFVNSTTGYAIMSDGKLLKSINGGQSWSVQMTMQDQPNSICFTSATTGYISNYLYVLKTTNAGVSWTPVYGGHNLGGSSVVFVDDTTGYVSQYDTILKTTDAGAHWSATPLPGTSLNRLFFTSRDTGFCVEHGDYILYTYNGGLSWERQNAPNSGSLGLICLYFRGGTGVAGGVYGYLDNTTNYGGGAGRPFALCSHVTAGCDTNITILNNSWVGYTMRWYFNGQYINSNYNFSHHATVGIGNDTTSLIVSNSAFSDTNTIITARVIVSHAPRRPVIHFYSDTICPINYVTLIVDSTISGIPYRVFTNGVQTGSFIGNNATVTFQNYANIVGDTKITITLTDSNACHYYRDSVSKTVYTPPSYRGRAMLIDTIVCNNGIARVRIDSSSPWYTYNVWTSPVRGTGGTIYLYDTISTIPYISSVLMTVTNQTINQCPLTNTIMARDSVHVRWPRVYYTAVDSFAYVNDTIHLVNSSFADTYVWGFDNTANKLSDTARNSSVVYHSAGEKTIMLIGNTIQHCIGDTSIKYVYIGAPAQHDTIGGSCRESDIDTNTYTHGGILAYHVDRFGNSYTGGYEFCCSNGAAYSTAAAAYLRKTDRNGNSVWYKNIPMQIKNNNLFYSAYVTGVTTDSNGNVYIAGNFGSNTGLKFDSITIPSSYHLTCAKNIFIAKFDSTGAKKWIIYSDLGGDDIACTDIKYRDDEHIFIAVTTGNSAVGRIHFTDTTAYQDYYGLNVLQINSRGAYRNRTKSISTSGPSGPFNPDYPNNNLPPRNTMIGPKLFLHDDCTISVLGFMSLDSFRFNSAVSIYSFAPRYALSAFVATLDPDAGWLGAHTLFGTNMLQPENGAISNDYAATRYRDMYLSQDFIPRFDFDRDRNLYMIANVDSVYFSPTASTYSNTNNNLSPNNTYMMVAKFDRNGHKIWHTKNRYYSRLYRIAGINLTPDQSEIILTGNYSGGANLTSTHRTPILMRTGSAGASFIASMDTAGDVKWLDNIGIPDLANAFANTTGNGSIYILTKSHGKNHEIKYSLSGICHLSDTVRPVPPCVQGLVITLAAGNMPVCDSQSCNFTVHNGSTAPGTIFRWYLNGAYTGDTGQVYLDPQAINGQTVQCVMTLPGGVVVNSNILTIVTAPTFTPEIHVLFSCGGCSATDTILYDCPGDTVHVMSLSNFADAFEWMINGVHVGGNYSTFDTVRYWSGDGAITCRLISHYACTIPHDTLSNALHVMSPTDTAIITRTQNMLVSSPSSSYQWYLNDTLLTGMTGQSITITRTGVYSVDITDPTYGCQLRSSYPATTIIGIAMLRSDQISVYPSPTHGIIIVESGIGATDLIVNDIYGHAIYTEKIIAPRQNIDIHSLPAGIYMLGVKTLGQYQFFKIVKE